MVAKGRAINSGWLQEGLIRGSMLGKTILPGDEELGKKDDDHKFAPSRRPHWSTWHHHFRWRRRRILLAVLCLFLLYLYYHSNGEQFDGPGNEGQRYPLGRPTTPSTYDTYERPSSDDDEPTGPPPGTHKPKHGEAIPHTYDGQIRFFRLARTLRKSASRMSGYEKRNRNVVFAVSSLKSASTLLPMVCEMSKWNRNHVHVVIMGREDILIENLLEINGVDKEQCVALWHDARPDYMEYSDDARAEAAVMGALKHIHSFLHPQAIIMDDASSEDAFFVRGMRNRTEKLEIPLIEVPKNKLEDLVWITRLDAGSLRNWHNPSMDILIQVPPDSSSVLRLLKSIKDADYSGLKPARIILELPAELDESVKQYVENFRWPPHNINPQAGSSLIIRRRISNHRATQEDSAIRFLELFYPTSTVNSHVLLLSPQVQLSPQYLHFVKYALLEYKYSSFGGLDNDHLMGLSLELPSVLLDGQNKLTLPAVKDMHTDMYNKMSPNTKSAPFLWQAPNSHATLFFGDKWAELHSFLSNRVVKHQESSKSTSRAKLVSATLPSWTEYMLEFMRARGYSLLYPATTSTALVTVHNELYHAPEEFLPEPLKRAGPLVPPEAADEPFLRADEPPRAPKNPEPPVTPGSLPLHMALPFNGDLPEISHLPQLLYDGSMIDPANVSSIATDFANTFREEVGGCKIPQGKHRKVIKGEARDLFCFGDEDQDDWEDDASDKVEMFDAPVEDAYDKTVGEELPTETSTATPTGIKTIVRPTNEADADEF
ncbi:Nn.00g113340.m01.CDS01 [Neocucurbitaria sp. VM-36]